MEEELFDVPISFHVFNRPETTRQVFDEIRKIRPKKLFITADGPRANRHLDSSKCKEVRSIVNKVDWDCELYTNFSDTNKGSFKSTSEGITWVFSYVDRAIILEDDCVPNNSFFKFCGELLDYYEHDTRVALISGTSFYERPPSQRYSYYFSRNTHLWGWATWKRTWVEVDFTMKRWPEYRDVNGLSVIFRYKHEVRYWEKIMQEMYEKKIGPHWDYLLLLTMYMNHTVAVRPTDNLVLNNGYGEDATHFDNKRAIQGVEAIEVSFPLEHPEYICRDVKAEVVSERLEFSGGLRRFLIDAIGFSLPESIQGIIRMVLKKNRNH